MDDLIAELDAQSRRDVEDEGPDFPSRSGVAEGRSDRYLRDLVYEAFAAESGPLPPAFEEVPRSHA